MNLRIYCLLVSTVFVASCNTMPYDYEKSEQERRYQFMEDQTGGIAYSTGGWRAAPRKKWTKTFTALAPEGNWTVSGPYSFGNIFFVGGIPGYAWSKYAGVKVQVRLDTADEKRLARDEGRQRRLRALKENDIRSFMDDELRDEQEKNSVRIKEYSPGGRRDSAPPLRNISMKLTVYRGLTCTLYEDEQPFLFGSYDGKPGRSFEQYGFGFFCQGFLNGRLAEFGYGGTIMVDNQHIADGVTIDPQELRRELYQRMQRTMDSVQFDGEFTQTVPASYR